MFEGFDEWLDENPITDDELEDFYQSYMRSKKMSSDELFQERYDSDPEFRKQIEIEEYYSNLLEEHYENLWRQEHPIRAFLEDVKTRFSVFLRRYRNKKNYGELPF